MAMQCKQFFVIHTITPSDKKINGELTNRLRKKKRTKAKSNFFEDSQFSIQFAYY